VAIVDGKEITREDIQKIAFVAGPRFTSMLQVDPKAALFEWFLTQHLGKEGAELKLDQQSPLKEEIEAIRMQYLRDARINMEMNTYRAPQADVEKYYAQHANRYQRVKVSGVYVKFKPNENQGTGTAALAAAAAAILSAGQVQRPEEDARTLALDIAKRLRAGEDMAKLAEQYSEDAASKTKGGEIGWVNFASNYPAEFTLGALALAKDDVSNPIRLPGGFYILRADDRTAMPLDDASSDIQVELKKVHLDEFMKGLNERFRPQIVDPTLIVQPAAGQQGTGPQR
jgi:parvulin-like peptidyl-prolyl isomerase